MRGGEGRRRKGKGTCNIFSCVESLVEQLFLLTQPGVHPIIRQQGFRYLYLVSKVRGPKVMVRWFPHEVSDFDPVLKSLQQQDPYDCEVCLATPSLQHISSQLLATPSLQRTPSQLLATPSLSAISHTQFVSY